MTRLIVVSLLLGALVGSAAAQAPPGLSLSFFPFGSFTGGIVVGACGPDAAGRLWIAVGAGPGGGPHVQLFYSRGADELLGPVYSFFAYEATFSGGVHVACGINQFGVAELVIGPGPGAVLPVRTFMLPLP